jgi:hypothetical protein
MNDVVITLSNGGLGRKDASDDAISGLVASGVAVVGGVQLDTVYLLASIEDALSLKIDDAYDTTNHVLVYEHVKEFFRINQNGTLYLYVSAQDTTYENLVAVKAKALLLAAEGKIKRLGVAWNPTGTIPAFESVNESTPSEAIKAITAAATLVSSEFAAHRPVIIIMEGKKYTVSSTPFDIRSLNARGVMVMVGQSLWTANRDPLWAGYAAVGTALGARSLARVNEKHSWVGKFNLFGGSLTAAGINNTSIATISQGNLEAVDASGAQFFRRHTGIDGFYFNHTAAAIAVTDDYSFIEYSEVINKAARLVRAALLPRLESPVAIDVKTGKLPAVVIQSLQSLGKRALEELLLNNEISGLDIYINPDQNLLATGELEVSFELIPTGSASNIAVKIGFKNPAA